ncbi:unnamed protein product [Closterium sp. NIES-53]
MVASWSRPPVAARSSHAAPARPVPVPSPSSGAQCAQPHARSHECAAAHTSPAARATAAKCTAAAASAVAAARTNAASRAAADTRATAAACCAAPPYLPPFSLLLVHQRGGGRGRFVGGATLVAVVSALSLPPVPFSSPPSPFLLTRASAERGGGGWGGGGRGVEPAPCPCLCQHQRLWGVGCWGWRIVEGEGVAGGVLQRQLPTSSSSLFLPPVVVLGRGGMSLEVKAVVGGVLQREVPGGG